MISFILYCLGLVIYIVTLLFKIDHVNLYLLLVTLLAGYHVSLEGIISSIQQTKKIKKLALNAHILMLLAALGAIFTNNMKEAAVLMLIFSGSHYLEEFAESKSKKEMHALLKLKPQNALVMNGNTFELIDIEHIPANSIVRVLNGQQIPLDGVIVDGGSNINESTINGESIPVYKTVNDEVFAGTLNCDETFLMKTTKRFDDTLFAKILRLVEAAQSKKSKVQTFIQKFEFHYVRIVVLMLPFIYLILHFGFKYSLYDSFYRTLIFLVIASPCALAVSATPAMLASMSFLAKNKVLVKGSSYIANFKEIKAIAFDKTGTLTTGQMEVIACSINDSTILGIIKQIEQQANHPIARSIVSYLNNYESNFEIHVENKVGVGIVGYYKDDKYTLFKQDAYTDLGIFESELREFAVIGATVVVVAKNDEIIGYIALNDTIHPSAKVMIETLIANGVVPVIISGDNANAVNYVGNQLGIREVYSNVFPEDKQKIVKEIQKRYGMCAMIGDGINDSIALSSADISVAMGEGSDVAIESADIILMNNDIRQINRLFDVSKKLDQTIRLNIIFAMAVIIVLVILNFLGISNILTSVIGHESSTLLIILFSLRMLFA